MSPLPLIATVRSDVAALRIWVDRYRCIRRRRRTRSEIVCVKSGRGGTVKRHTRSRTIERNLSVLTRFRPLTLISKTTARSRSLLGATVNGGAAVIGEVSLPSSSGDNPIRV